MDISCAPYKIPREWILSCAAEALYKVEAEVHAVLRCESHLDGTNGG